MSSPAVLNLSGKPSDSPFSGAAVAWLIVVGVTAVCALLLLAAFAPQLKREDDGGGHVLSRNAMGFAALAKLIGDTGQPVRVLRGPIADRSGLVVLTPALGQGVDDIQAVEAPGPRLVILPKWRVSPDPRKRRWVIIEAILPRELVARTVAAFSPKSQVRRRSDTVRPSLTVAGGGTVATGPVRDLQTFTGPDWRPLVTTPDGGMVVGCLDSLCVLSDPDLANTHGLADLRTARFAVGLVQQLKGPGPVAFDASLHGFSQKQQRNVLRLLFTPPFLGVTLCLAAMTALLAAHAAVRFGAAARAVRAIALGKAGLADNTAALIRRAGREHRMLGRYALVQRDAVAAAVGAPRHLDEAALETLLDRLSDAAGVERISDLLARARQVGPRGDLLTVARSLHQWRMEMTRER